MKGKAGFGYFREVLCEAVEQELALSETLEYELAGLPAGKLAIAKDGNHYYFSNHMGRVNKGITRNKELVYKLARRRYLECLLKELKDDLNFARKAKAYLKAGQNVETEKTRRLYSSTAELLDVFQDAGLDIMRITCSAKQYEWSKAEYKKNELYPEQLKYRTSADVAVRSKSEQAIGNVLEAFGIPYRYEQGLRVEVQWMEIGGEMIAPKYKTYYPDFSIMLPNGQLIIWEHLGRVDLNSYRNHNAEKISALRGSGAVHFDNFIVTYESDILSISDIEHIVVSRILMRMVR